MIAATAYSVFNIAIMVKYIVSPFSAYHQVFLEGLVGLLAPDGLPFGLP